MEGMQSKWFRKNVWQASTYIIVDRKKFEAADTWDEAFAAIVYFGYTAEMTPWARLIAHRGKNFPTGAYEMILIRTWHAKDTRNFFGREGMEAIVDEFALEILAKKHNFGSTNSAGTDKATTDGFYGELATQGSRVLDAEKCLFAAIAEKKYVTEQFYYCPAVGCSHKAIRKEDIIDHAGVMHGGPVRIRWCNKCEVPQQFNCRISSSLRRVPSRRPEVSQVRLRTFASFQFHCRVQRSLQ